MKKLVPPFKELDPAIAAFIRALACECARQDHDEIFNGIKRPTVEPRPATAKRRIKTNVVRRISDGQDGYTRQPVERREENEQFRLIIDHCREAAEDWKAGRHDPFGISKFFGMRFPRKSPKV